MCGPLEIESHLGRELGVAAERSTVRGRNGSLPWLSTARRLARVAGGITAVYCGFALALRADLGTGPFNVLQQGIAARLGISVGHAGWLNGAVFVVAAWRLGQRPGLATITSAMMGGLILDELLAHVGLPSSLLVRSGMTVSGLGLMSAGGALYLSAGLGASPIDSLMTALHRSAGGRIPLFAVRTVMEFGALLVGWLEGGVVGAGTLVIGLGIGPGLHACLRLFGTPYPPLGTRRAVVRPGTLPPPSVPTGIAPRMPDHGGDARWTDP